MSKLFVCILPLFLIGCIHRPVAEHLIGVPGATPPPPPSPVAVAACNKTLTWHNIWIMGGTLFGGFAGSGAAVDSVSSNKGVQEGVGIGAAASGVLAGVSATAAGIEADAYSRNNCAVILQAAANAAASSTATP